MAAAGWKEVWSPAEIEIMMNAQEFIGEAGADSLRLCCLEVLSELGLWSMTRPLSSLAILLTNVRDLRQDPIDLTHNVTAESLGAFPKHIQGLAHFLSDDFMLSKKDFLQRVTMAMSTLGDLMWNPQMPDDLDDMHTVLFESFRTLQSIECLLGCVISKEEGDCGASVKSA